MLRLPLKKLFWKGIRYRKLRRVLLLLFLALALQLRYSQRARNYAVRCTINILVSGTFFGLLGTLVLLGVKLRLHNEHNKALQSVRSE